MAFRPILRGVLGAGTSLRAAVIAALSPDTFAIFDPSDGETRYQDSAGTTLADTSTNPIGLHLDVSQGLELGSELVTNGTFDSDISGWSASTTGTTAAWTDGAMEVTHAGNVGREGFASGITLESGKFYEVSFDVLSVSGGTAGLYLTDVGIGTTTGRLIIRDSVGAGSYSSIVEVADQAFVQAIVVGSAGDTATFDNITIRELPGYHAVQDTTAEKPLYDLTDGIHSVEHDLFDDNLVATFPDLGTDATVKYVTSSGITTLENQTISGDYTLPQATWQGVVIYEGPMSSAQAAAVDAWLNSKAGL